jgi:Domain of unknown function (DUF4386)
MAGSALVYGVLTAPLFGAPDFLATAAAHSQQIGLSVLLGLVTGALFVAIAITAFPIFCQYSQALAFWFMALAVVALAVTAVEHAGMMSMVSLSEAYARAGPAERDQLRALRVVVTSARNWTHYLGRIADGSALLVLYAVLYRFALVPRALAAFGLLAVMLQLTTLAGPLFGRPVVVPMLAPLGVSQLALALWLIIKGFRTA